MTTARTVTIPLFAPIVRGETRIEELQLRKPLPTELIGVELYALMRMDTGSVLAVVPRISTPPLLPEEAATMDAADFFRCATEISDFLLETGSPTASPPR